MLIVVLLRFEKFMCFGARCEDLDTVLNLWVAVISMAGQALGYMRTL